MPHAAHVLIVDTDPGTAALARKVFRDSDVRFFAVESRPAAKRALSERHFDVILLGFSETPAEDLPFLRRIHKAWPRIPLVVISESDDSVAPIEAVKAGAFDFLHRPVEEKDLSRTVCEAIECARKALEPVAINPRSRSAQVSNTLVGNSRAMLDVYKELGRISPTPATVLIRGETGTGKELVARALYQHGHRAHLPFITVNCAAIPANLLESELFGHEKGAFTGATSTRLGKFELANNATLFLDEIGDLDHALQAKLLRVLQEKRFQRVGGSSEISVDVRVIAATHRPIETMIESGEFREDLFYRLNVATIKLPPLRNRVGDVPLLTSFFLHRYSEEMGLPLAAITRDALSRLESSRLPGNVRQLQNILRKALIHTRGYPIDKRLVEELLEETESAEPVSHARKDIAAYCRQLVAEAAEGANFDLYQQAVEEMEQALLREALRHSNGNITLASKWLGISRPTLREKAKKHGLARGR